MNSVSYIVVICCKVVEICRDMSQIDVTSSVLSPSHRPLLDIAYFSNPVLVTKIIGI